MNIQRAFSCTIDKERNEHEIVALCRRLSAANPWQTDRGGRIPIVCRKDHDEVQDEAGRQVAP